MAQNVATLTLVEFLTARIEEDEERARSLASHTEGDPHRPFEDWQPFKEWHLAWHDECDSPRVEPTRAIREVEAKRAIVAQGPSECSGYERQIEYGGHHYPDPAWAFCDGCSAAASVDMGWQLVLHHLAAVYADHEDYQQEWRP